MSFGKTKLATLLEARKRLKQASLKKEAVIGKLMNLAGNLAAGGYGAVGAGQGLVGGGQYLFGDEDKGKSRMSSGLGNLGMASSITASTPSLAKRFGGVGSNRVGALGALGAPVAIGQGFHDLGSAYDNLREGNLGSAAWDAGMGTMNLGMGAQNIGAFAKSPIGKGAINISKDLGGKAFQAGRPILSNLANNARPAITNAVNNARPAFNNILNSARPALTNLANNARPMMTSAVNSMRPMAGSLARNAAVAGTAALPAVARLGAGMAIEGANQVIPHYQGDSYWGQVGNELRDQAVHTGAGAASGGLLGAVVGAGAGLANKVYRLGTTAKELYDTNKETARINAENARLEKIVADKHRAMVTGQNQPAQPVQPAQPSPAPAPVQSAAPVQPQPTQPVQPVQPVQAQPAQPTAPKPQETQVASAPQPTQAVEPTPPIESAKPSAPLPPTEIKQPLPRPDDSGTLIRHDNQFDHGYPPEDVAHNREVLENRVAERKASGLPPNPFIGRVVGVDMPDSNGNTYRHKPTNFTADQHEVVQTAKNQIDTGGGSSGYRVVPTANGGNQLIGPDGQVHGTMTPAAPKAPGAPPAAPRQSMIEGIPSKDWFAQHGVTPPVKTGGLFRRNTGILEDGEVWVNPEDFNYLDKSAMFIGLTPEDYSKLPPSSAPEGIRSFFFPVG